jgi:short-subunit dehydrogenase
LSDLAVITGATSGIGAEFARQLAPLHKTIWLIGRREQKLNQLAEDLYAQYGIEVVVMIMDLSDRKVIEKLAEQPKQQSGLSMLINNAGYSEDGDFHSIEWKKHNDIMNVHVEATLKLSYVALKIISENRQGSIINVASVASFIPTPNSPLYGPTKKFIRSLSKPLAPVYKEKMCIYKSYARVLRSQISMKKLVLTRLLFIKAMALCAHGLPNSLLKSL